MAFGIDNKQLLQVVILSLLEDDGLTIHEVVALTTKTTAAVWQGLRQESLEESKWNLPDRRASLGRTYLA